jgi:hypothetical protein
VMTRITGSGQIESIVKRLNPRYVRHLLMVVGVFRLMNTDSLEEYVKRAISQARLVGKEKRDCLG